MPGDDLKANEAICAFGWGGASVSGLSVVWQFFLCCIWYCPHSWKVPESKARTSVAIFARS